MRIEAEIQKNVVWFQISMQDPPVLQVLECVSNALDYYRSLLLSRTHCLSFVQCGQLCALNCPLNAFPL